jgi:hypothetical protein
MSSDKYTKFIKREQDLDPLCLFGARTTEIVGSVIAFAYGTHNDGTPNIMGTGFSLANLEDADLFATCYHVMDRIRQIRDLPLDEMKNHGLIDKIRRIAFLDGDHFRWKEVGPIRFSDKIEHKGENLALKDDACICRVPGINLRPLELSPDEYFIGSELGIIGFPFFERLQTHSVQPYVQRAILSCHMRYPLERDDGKLAESERIALDCMAGIGFSGSPVFSIRDGRVVGMVDYLPSESYIEDLKIRYPACEERDIRVHYAAGISFAVPSKTIQKFLNGSMQMDWQKPGDQAITIR